MIPTPKTNVIAIMPTENVLIFLPPANKKPVVSVHHGPAKFLLLRQPGCPRNWDPWLSVP